MAKRLSDLISDVLRLISPFNLWISIDDQDLNASIYDLPDHILVEIFSNLALEEQIRAGRVSTVFNEISRISMTYLKWLDLDDAVLKKMGYRSFKSILELCAKRLQRVKFEHLSDVRLFNSFLDAFAEYSFPGLKKLDFTGHQVSGDVFSTLMKKCPNLRCLEWRAREPGPFPDGTWEKMERIKFSWCNDDVLRSMIGKVPSLKTFEVGCHATSTPFIDQLFRTTPDMRIVSLFNIDCRAITSLWNLRSLVDLDVFCSSEHSAIDNDFLKKIAASFPGLQQLYLSGAAVVTAVGIGALGLLTELRDMTLRFDVTFDDDVYTELRRFASCERLEYISIDCVMPVVAMVSLIRYCPSLRYLFVRTVSQSDPPEAVAAMLETLVRPTPTNNFGIIAAYCFAIIERLISPPSFLRTRYVTIFCNEDNVVGGVWTSDRVRAALENLRSDNLCIRFF